MRTFAKLCVFCSGANLPRSRDKYANEWPATEPRMSVSPTGCSRFAKTESRARSLYLMAFYGSRARSFSYSKSIPYGQAGNRKSRFIYNNLFIRLILTIEHPAANEYVVPQDYGFVIQPERVRFVRMQRAIFWSAGMRGKIFLREKT
jgi:hypothetical protein